MKKIFVETKKKPSNNGLLIKTFFFPLDNFFLYLDLGATYQLQMENCEYFSWDIGRPWTRR